MLAKVIYLDSIKEKHFLKYLSVLTLEQKNVCDIIIILHKIVSDKISLYLSVLKCGQFVSLVFQCRSLLIII